MHNKVLTHHEVKQLIGSNELLPTTKKNSFGEDEYTDRWYFADNETELYHLIAADDKIIFRLADVAGNS